MVSRIPTDLIRDCCAGWSRLDPDELMSYFADGAVHHTMPGPPAEGRDAVRRTIESSLTGNFPHEDAGIA